MKTHYTVELSSPHAIALMTREATWCGNRTMVMAALNKLTHLGQLAKQRYVYACPLLIACHELIDNVQSALLTQMAKYQQQFNLRDMPANKFKAATRYQRAFPLYHSLIFDLLRTIEYFDTTVCLVMGARQTKVFVDKHTAFAVIYQQQKLLHTLLTTLCQVKLKELPEISIKDYLENTQRYRKVANQLGVINPNHVLAAIQHDLLPHLSIKQSMRYQQQLQAQLTR